MLDKMAMWFAWKMPRRLVYMCAVRVHAHATQGEYSEQTVPDLTAMDALARWDGRPMSDDDDSVRENVALELAWGLIANAWDWVKNPEWTKAAERWRDEHWHPSLASDEPDLTGS